MRAFGGGPNDAIDDGVALLRIFILEIFPILEPALEVGDDEADAEEEVEVEVEVEEDATDTAATAIW